jgi:bifunctional lysine-specific demethylase and histidyl-hydroxylase NO66
MAISSQLADTLTAQPGIPGECPDGDSWLAYCFGDPERFFAESWNSTPIVNQGRAHRFRQVFGMNELSDLLSMGAIAPSQIRLLKDGKQVPSRLWVDVIPSAADSRPTMVPNLDRIREIVIQGCTLTISAMQAVSTGIYRLCSGLETELSHQIKASVYFTPPASQCFGAHSDEHDVIVLQLEGEKEWRIFDRDTGPQRGPRNVTLPGEQEPRSTFRLEAGDSLYLPRRYVHSVAATEQSSLHISVGVRLATVGDLLEHAVRDLKLAPELARPLMPGFSRHSPQLSDVLSEAGAYLQRRLGEGSDADKLAAAFRGSCGQPPAQIADLAEMYRDREEA